MPEMETKQPEKTDGQQTSGSASGASAAEKKEPQTTGAGGSNGTEKRQDNREAEKNRTFFQARREKKASLEERMEKLSEQVTKALETREAPQKQGGRKSILDVEDPDEHLDQRYGSPLEEIKKEVAELKALHAAREQEARSHAQLNAEESILTRKHFQDPRFTEEAMANWNNSPELQAIGKVYPDKALELNYLATCKKMGVTPDLGTDTALGGHASGGRPVLGRRVENGERSFAEWKAYVSQADRGSDEYTKRTQEMKQAVSEGRVK